MLSHTDRSRFLLHHSLVCDGVLLRIGFVRDGCQCRRIVWCEGGLGHRFRFFFIGQIDCLAAEILPYRNVATWTARMLLLSGIGAVSRGRRSFDDLCIRSR